MKSTSPIQCSNKEKKILIAASSSKKNSNDHTNVILHFKIKTTNLITVTICWPSPFPHPEDHSNDEPAPLPSRTTLTFCSDDSNITSILPIPYHLRSITPFDVNFAQKHPQLSSHMQSPLYDTILPFDVWRSLLCLYCFQHVHSIAELRLLFPFCHNNIPSHSTFSNLSVLRGQLYCSSKEHSYSYFVIHRFAQVHTKL